MLIRGIDLSWANGDGTSKPLPDWTRIAGDSEVRFAYLRACYGAQTEDYSPSGFTAFQHNHDGAKAHGIPSGPYLFWRRPTDPLMQARYFLRVIDGYEGQNRPVVDVEELSFDPSAPIDIPGNIAALAQTLDAITAAMGCQPIPYTDPNTWQTYFGGTDAFSGHGFWIANYGVTPGQPEVPAGIKTVLLHQYADDGIVPGVQGVVDLDVLLGATETIAR